MKKTYDKMTLPELQTQEKIVKTIRGIFIGMGIFFIASCIFLITQEGFNTISILPIVFLPIYVLIEWVSRKNLKSIQAEISKREREYLAEI